MSKTIIETTKNTTQATEASKNAGKVAKEGGHVVEETIDGMIKISEVVKQSAETVQALGKSSDQIGEIVQVIDDIEYRIDKQCDAGKRKRYSANSSRIGRS